ncbi:MAG: asparagine synthase (glutamine-hydrolyzing) [Desulfobacca sp. RBG_16_60_12]|nr:MAG: asparagine synthase (glutamine-hydrolyzing) [Desulfobacca sp. RBG_16_60_12]
MCGIAGIINLDLQKPVDPADLRNMTRALSHRGPDDEGFYVEGPVGLGHRRLAIIDLATGQQPIANEDHTIRIVGNGEIYNYQDLRHDLLKAGHRFASASDTEVVLHAYEMYGPDCVKLLNGMFALAIWDGVRRRLFLARDRAGIKPLYYARAPGVFLFGSELKAILQHPALERRLDVTALNQYLSLEYVPTPRTIFAGISKLPPGHTLILEVDRDRLTVRSYWDMSLSRSEGRGKPRLADYVAEFNHIFPDVIRQELVADVPVGVLLSGGMDSSAVAAQAVKCSPAKVQSFTVAFEDASFDESVYARRVARYLGTEHAEMTLTAGRVLELVPRLADFLDEPLGDSSFLPSFFLSEFARRRVKVALGGDGGDELFAGYSTLQAHQLSKYYQGLIPKWLHDHLAGRMLNCLPVSFNNLSLDFKVRRFLQGQAFTPLIRHHHWLGSFTPQQIQRHLRPGMGGEGEMENLIADHGRQSGAREVLNQVLYCDMKLYLEGDILPKVDRASMANSLEVRVPFLNARLLEFAGRLPLRFKLRGFTRKYLLRQAFKDLLPPGIIHRSKKGFNMPVAKWLTGPLKPLAADLFSEARLKRAGLFNPQYVQTLLAEHLSRRRDHRKLLWTLLVFELWREKWLGP